VSLNVQIVNNYKLFIMKKSISKLGKILTKKELKNTNGEIAIISNICETLCLTASSGTRCVSDGYLAACNGRGGFVYY